MRNEAGFFMMSFYVCILRSIPFHGDRFFPYPAYIFLILEIFGHPGRFLAVLDQY